MTTAPPRPTWLQDGVVIGEGVLLDTHPASVASRLLGAVLDLVALLVVGVLAAIVLANLPLTLDQYTSRIAGIVLLVTVTVVLPTTVETLTRGRSLGKLAAGVRIVRDDGGPITFRQAFVRALTGVGELWLTLGSAAVICSIVHPQGKRIGDVLAGTYGSRVRAAAGTLSRYCRPATGSPASEASSALAYSASGMSGCDISRPSITPRAWAIMPWRR